MWEVAKHKTSLNDVWILREYENVLICIILEAFYFAISIFVCVILGKGKSLILYKVNDGIFIFEILDGGHKFNNW